MFNLRSRNTADMRITFNALFTLLFTLTASLCFVLFQYNQVPHEIFVLPGKFDLGNPFWYISLVGYTLGHASPAHLIGNMSIVLLLGPIVERRYGTKRLFMMVSLTGFITAMVHVVFFDHRLLGASGIVFMLIVLSSMVEMKKNEIPFTFVLIVLIYVGREVFAAFHEDEVSQFAHIAGGVIGTIFGFWYRSSSRT